MRSSPRSALHPDTPRIRTGSPAFSRPAAGRSSLRRPFLFGEFETHDLVVIGPESPNGDLLRKIVGVLDRSDAAHLEHLVAAWPSMADALLNEAKRFAVFERDVPRGTDEIHREQLVAGLLLRIGLEA